MSGLSELADTGFVYESGRVNAGVGNDVYELGPDGQLRVVFTLYSIICQAWKQWSLGDPEGGDVEQEVSGLDIYMVGVCLGLACRFQKN